MAGRRTTVVALFMFQRGGGNGGERVIVVNLVLRCLPMVMNSVMYELIT